MSFVFFFVFQWWEDPLLSYLRRQETEGKPFKDPESVVPTETGTELGLPVTYHDRHRTRDPVKIEQLAPLTVRETATIAVFFFIIYLPSNWATNLSFYATSVSSASILASTCGFFTLVLGWLMGIEQMSVMRVLAVGISVGGVLLIGIPELASPTNSMFGNGLALVGAFLYGVYSVFLKRVTIDESRMNMTLLFAFGGLYAMLIVIPGCWLLDWTNIEPFALPSTPHMWLCLLTNIIFGGLIPSYLWNVAFACTSPLIVAIGISFNIPLTLAVEYFLEGPPLDLLKLAAAMCVVTGFIIVNLASIYPQMDASGEQLLVQLGWIEESEVSGGSATCFTKKNSPDSSALSKTCSTVSLADPLRS